jgi:hypothetical protein
MRSVVMWYGHPYMCGVQYVSSCMLHTWVAMSVL